MPNEDYLQKLQTATETVAAMGWPPVWCGTVYTAPNGIRIEPSAIMRGMLVNDAIAMLRDLEWAGNGRTYSYCKSCLADRSQGHFDDCKLADILRRAKDEK